ncbi:DUF397 domain-containing protein [Streptomyces sp. NPDC050703]|uniref:DUF397 domain-containing protein n=1 Tax=Streptomyces sp. NPDC050703 TaxID=3157218 RepID=UPI00341ECB82
MTATPRHVRTSSTLQGARWRRSSHSNGMNNCVETATLDTGRPNRLLAVRDSKNTEGSALLFSPGPWEIFLDSLR